MIVCVKYQTMSSYGSGPQKADVGGGIELAYETHGDPAGECVVLIAGHGYQYIGFQVADIVEPFVAAGYYVVRFDNRDTGLSSRYTDGGSCAGRGLRIALGQLWNKSGLPVASLLLVLMGLWLLRIDVSRAAAAAAVALGMALHLGVGRSLVSFAEPTTGASYGIADMAADTAGLLNHLNVKQAHLVGASMGGMIAQEFACTYPQRARSLVLFFTSPGPAIALHEPTLLNLLKVHYYNVKMLQAGKAAAADNASPKEKVAAVAPHKLALARCVKTKAFFSEEETLQHLTAQVLRCDDDTGKARQSVAILCRGNNLDRLAQLRLPALVIHGDADILIPYQNGVTLAETIPGARLATIEEGGHDLAPGHCPAFCREMLALFRGQPRPARTTISPK